MAVFERIKSGISQMDEALNHIRLGDNVVWQMTGIEEFSLFLEPCVKQAIEDGREVVYIRFAAHRPLLESQEGVQVFPVELSSRFERFTVAIHNMIKQKGTNVFYIFDCLSEMQTAWATDLMMWNFFTVTCPLLTRLEAVAFFPLLRGMHSFQAIARIRDTTQLFLDVYSDAKHVYMRPLKVWNRYSDTMFLPHVYDRSTGSFVTLTEGVELSRFYYLMNRQQAACKDQHMDSWDRFFSEAEQKYYQGIDIREECDRMCNIMMSRDEKMRELIKKNFWPEDYFCVRNRMIGTGMIGGKACGMLLARKVLENRRPDLFEKLEPHDSYYIGSDVFYSFIVRNKFWDIRVRQRTREEYFSLAPVLAKCLREGEFSESLKEEFCRLLDYYGQDPIIVRSSSILEDGFGNAFAGKYESVFCANHGTMEERLHEFEEAIKTVYESTLSTSALDYRLRRGLEERDEQMALLVMRVSGSRYEDFFMPCAAGVGYSYSPYRFVKSVDPHAGMLRLVMGLGTGAVDRVQGSYPRLVSLDNPGLTPGMTSAEKHQYSQRKIDVINTVSGAVEHWELPDVGKKLPGYLKKLLLEHDFDAERMFQERGQWREILFVSCPGLVKNDKLMQDMREILGLIQEEYEYPVDVEYTMNISADGNYVINILQCRPLQVMEEREFVQIPSQIDRKKVFLESRQASMGLSRAMKLDYLVYVDPVLYYQMNYNDKYEIARALGAVNWYFREKEKNMMLMVPGRIGTSSPELGVPTTFADISEFDVICEMSEKRAGYMPELSYGSHIFQDLVEADILYTAVFDNEKTIVFCPEMIQEKKNLLVEIYPEGESLKEILGVYYLGDGESYVYHDVKEEHLICVM